MLRVRYIVIDPTFPHHLNSFDNVPLNYSKGPLVNITTKKTFETYYTNYINYTTQSSANGYVYKNFMTPYSNYQLLFYLTSMYWDGTRETAGDSKNRPINIRMNANVQSSSIYMVNVSVRIQTMITRMHFSMIIYDKADVEASHKYVLVLLQVNYTKSGGTTPIPKQFQTNLMMGLIELSSTKTSVCLHFNLNLIFATNPTMSIFMPTSNPRNNL